MRKIWPWYFLTILLTACTILTPQQAAPTPETEAPIPTWTSEAALPTRTAVPVISSPTLGPVEPSPSAQGDYRPFSAIIARMSPGSFVLLGGTENGEWLYPQTVVPHLPDGERYQIYGLEGAAGSARGKRPVKHQICQEYLVETDSYPLSGRRVGVTGDWEVMPRLAQEIPSDNATYLDAVRNWLVAQNIPDPVVDISQILRVDLEGDGTDEVLLAASHFVEPSGHSVLIGDYSLVIMRKVVKNSVVTIPLVADYYYADVENQFPLTYSGFLVVDLNNDDVLEVLVGVDRWEGSGAIVYEVDGTNVREVLNVFCGL